MTPKLLTEQQALELLHMTTEQLDARVASGSLTAYDTTEGRCFRQEQIEHYAFTRALLQQPACTDGTTEYTDDQGQLRRTRRIVWDD